MVSSIIQEGAHGCHEFIPELHIAIIIYFTSILDYHVYKYLIPIFFFTLDSFFFLFYRKHLDRFYTASITASTTT